MDDNHIVRLIVFIFGVVFFIMPIYHFWQRKFFAKNGIRTKATVTDVKTRIGGGKRRRIYYAHTVEYQADGVHTTSELTESYPRDVGYEYNILYIPDKPEKIMNAEHIDKVTKENVFCGVFIVIGAILLIISVIMFFIY